MPKPPDHPLERLRRGDLAGAERLCRAVLARDPRHAGAHHVLGIVALRRGDASRARRWLSDAVALAPGDPGLHVALAEACHRAGDATVAEGECAVALRLDSECAPALNLLGRMAIERTDYDSALECFRRAALRRPPDLDALVNLGVVCNRVGEFERAIGFCARVLERVPDHPHALTNLGLALRASGRGAEAKAAFERAGDFPPARFNLGYTLLLEGDFERGLPLYEERRRLGRIAPPRPAPEWDGRPRPGRTLLVAREQGLGDTLLASRWLAAAAERVGRIVLEAPPPLARLLRAAFPAIECVTDAADAAFDLWIPQMSLPLRLGARAADAGATAPWLALADAPAPSAARAGEPVVGLNWAGNPAFAYDRLRSTSLDTLAPLLTLPGVCFVSLHRGVREHEAAARGLPEPIASASDFLDTARVVAGLDAVVSTETAVPNLSAAMGIPTIVLGAPDADWRWRHGFPGVVLCARDAALDWTAAVAAAREALAERLARRAA